MAEQIYFSVFTTQGLALLTEAIQNGTKLGITHMAFGDGGGSLPTPEANVESLVNEVHRTSLNSLAPDPKNANWLRAEAIIASAIGGFNIRELGLYAGDVLVAYSNYPPTFKPNPSDGTARIMTFRMVLQIDNAANFELVIDPDIVLATIQHVTNIKNELEADIKTRVATLKDYGAIGDGLYHPLYEQFPTLESAKLAYPTCADRITSLDQSIDWVAAQEAINNHKKILVDSKWYIITDTIIIPDGHGFEGQGGQYLRASEESYDDRSAFIFYGEGDKNYNCPTLADDVYQVANPDAGAPYLADSGTRGDVYKLQNYAEDFSVAVQLGAGSYLTDILVAPYHSINSGDAMSGYSDSSTGAVADHWDVGILALNVKSWHLNFVNAGFQWRKAGLLIAAAYQNKDDTIANDEWSVYNSVFAGATGVGVRSDNYNTDGFLNYGFANGAMFNCLIYGYNHRSAHLCTSDYLDAPLDRPSACLEMSGANIKPRGVDFNSCTFFGRDDISIFAGYAQEIKFIGCYQETKNCKINGQWTGGAGSRMVVSADATLEFIAHAKYGIDYSPNFYRHSSVTRYTSAAGTFSTASISADDDYEDFRYANSNGKRMRRSTSKWAITSHDFANDLISVASDGTVSSLRHINSGSALTSQTYLAVGSNATINGSALIGNGITFAGANADAQLRRQNASGVNTIFLAYQASGAELATYQSFVPNVSATYDLGSASRLFNNVYASNGTIQTSDRNYKQQFRTLDDAERSAALQIKSEIQLFKFNDAVEEKDEDARWHAGVIAQEVIDILTAHGLDWQKYGFVCYDEWEASEAVIDTWDDEYHEIPATYDMEGNIITEAYQQLVRSAGSAVVKPARSAGSRYAIRYDELAMFILSAI